MIAYTSWFTALWQMRCLKGDSCFLVACFVNWISVVFCNHFVHFLFTQNVLVLISACSLIDTATAQTHNQSTVMKEFRWHKLKKKQNYEAKFKNINTLSQNMTKYFTLQPEFHLSQRWRSPYLRSQWGADHWASSFTHAPDIGPTATSAPAQSHVPGLLCVSLGHGRGELSGTRENCWARARNSPAPCHGMLPKLSSPLPGKVSLHYVQPNVLWIYLFFCFLIYYAFSVHSECHLFSIFIVSVLCEEKNCELFSYFAMNVQRHERGCMRYTVNCCIYLELFYLSPSPLGLQLVCQTTHQ